MGALIYDGARVEFDDRVLAHLQVVIVQRLRRHESVLISWFDALQDGDGRSSVWLSSALPVRFEFATPRPPEIDRAWVQRLAETAAGRSGLLVEDLDGRPVRALHSTMANG